MAEQATREGGKYTIFYFDTVRGVELSARLSENAKIKLEIRAKMLNGDGKPCIAHFDLYRKSKNKSYKRSEPLEYHEGVVQETEDPLTGETEKRIVGTRQFTPGKLRETARKERRELGPTQAQPIKTGPSLSLHGRPARTSLIAWPEYGLGSENATILETMSEIESLPAGERKKIFGRTYKALSLSDKKTEKTIEEIKKQKSAANGKVAGKTKHQWQEKISAAADEHIPKVYVKRAKGSIDALTYEEYKAEFWVKRQKESSKTRDESLSDEEQEAIKRAWENNTVTRKKPDPALFKENDEPLPAPSKTAGLDKVFCAECEDALYETVEINGRKQTREVTPKQKLTSPITPKGYEVWLPSPSHENAEPYFLVIHRSPKGKNKIIAAARFHYTRHDISGKLQPVLAPYNDPVSGQAPVTHPSHTMYRKKESVVLDTAKEIAEAVHTDMLYLWYQKIGTPANKNMFGEPPQPSTRIQKVMHQGAGKSPAVGGLVA